MARYLADSTIWSWARRRPDIRARLAERVAAGEVVTCVPIVLEVLHGARDRVEYEEGLAELFEPLEWLSLSAEIGARSLQTQQRLASTTHGAHRLPAIDYLIAATAEVGAGDPAVLWHFDADLARICKLTGQPQEHEHHRPERSAG